MKYIEDFDANAGNGTDDTSRFASAFSTMGEGTIFLDPTKTYRIDSNLVIPANCGIAVDTGVNGSFSPNTNWNEYGTLGGKIKVHKNATLMMRQMSFLKGVVIINPDVLTYSAFTDTNYADPKSEAQAMIDGFAGTAITISESDTLLENLLILGYDRAVDTLNAPNSDDPDYTYNFSDKARTRFYNVNFDCTNGLRFSRSLDVARIHECHGWPFLTYGYNDGNAGWNSKDVATRSGYAFHCQGQTETPGGGQGTDWFRMDDCFAFGYFANFFIDDTRTVLLSNCGSDKPGYAGFYVGGRSARTTLVGCRSAGNDVSGAHFYISVEEWTTGKDDPNNRDRDHTKLIGCTSWEGGAHVQVNKGHAVVDGCSFEAGTQDEGWGVKIVNTAKKVAITNCIFSRVKGVDVSSSQKRDVYLDNNIFNSVTQGILTTGVYTQDNTLVINDDDATFLPLPGGDSDYGFFLLGGNNSEGGLVYYNGNIGHCEVFAQGAAGNFNATTGALNGTTGPNGKLNVSVTNPGGGVYLYIENRRGGTANLKLTWLGTTPV